MKTDDGNKTVSAFRAAYQLFIGPLPKDEIVLTKCHNRLCVNPEYLELVEEVPLGYWHRA